MGISFVAGMVFADALFDLGQPVKKRSGGQWRGHVVGFYKTKLTERGYCVESHYEKGSVQLYPEKALEPWNPEEDG